MGKNNKKGPKGNVFKVAGAKSLKKSKAKAVNLGLKNANLQTSVLLQKSRSTRHKRTLGQPIKHKRKPGSRQYQNYTQKQLEQCLAAIKAKELTQRDASDLYNIPRSTIKSKLANKHTNKPGNQPIFSEEEEALFVSRIATLSEFGFPLSNHDIKMIIKEYLTIQNKTVTIFNNNLPGRDWLKYFFDRHKSLCDYLETKFDQIRPQLSKTVITDFIDHVACETQNVLPQNIYSYFEIGLCNDPLKKKILAKRGVRYPENTIVEAAKVDFSVMMCGNAIGENLPPYVIYKSRPGCSTWTENGPTGAHYNCTQSGWMNLVTFENWFLVHLLPTLQKRKGRKVLIGDNNTSHITGEVLSLCKKYDIRFICVPHKANHILQPLHTAYFRPLKHMWRQLILDWRSSQIAKNRSTTLKRDFPLLLRKSLDALTNIKQYIKVGFEKTGIYPIDKHEPTYRFQNRHVIIDNHMLKYTDYDSDFAEEAWPTAVKEEYQETFPTENLEGTVSPTNAIMEDLVSTDAEDSEVYIIVVDGDNIVQIPLQGNLLNVAVGDHVIVAQGTNNYPGKVLSISDEGASIHCMKKWRSLWRWPLNMKEQLYSWDEIICKIGDPKLVKKGLFFIPEIVI